MSGPTSTAGNRRRLAVILVLVVLGIIVPGCGNDNPASYPAGDRAPLPEITAAPSDEQLPPNNQEVVDGIYGPALNELGYDLTAASLSGGPSARYTSQGEHLALYARPTNEPTADDYARGLWDLTALFATDVFQRWPELDSFDICQESHGAIEQPEDVVVTQLTATRRAAAAIDWDRDDLQSLLGLANGDDGVEVVVNKPASDSRLLRGP